MRNQHDIALTGLIGSKPLAALAAFGLLRWCEEIDALRGATLGWALEDDWIAVLGTPRPMTADELCRTLLEAHGAGKFPHLDWSPTLRVPADEFRARCIADAAAAEGAARLAADFDAAYGCGAVADNKGRLTPTRLDMTSGQQRFLELLADLAASLMPAGRPRGRQTPAALLEAVREALLGPWTYADSEHSLGWDADAERMHALRAMAPGNDAANKSVRFAVWLAHYALPLLPGVPVRGRLATTGFIVQRRQPPRFRWPVWEAPIGWASLASLLASANLLGSGAEIAVLHRRGVAAVYESLRHDFGQGYGVLRPARLVVARAAAPPPAAPLII